MIMNLLFEILELSIPAILCEFRRISLDHHSYFFLPTSVFEVDSIGSERPCDATRMDNDRRTLAKRKNNFEEYRAATHQVLNRFQLAFYHSSLYRSCNCCYKQRNNSIDFFDVKPLPCYARTSCTAPRTITRYPVYFLESYALLPRYMYT